MKSFKDRVVELRRVPGNELLANPLNWRKHPKDQQQIMSSVLDEVGFAGAALAYVDADGKLVLIDGHMRAKQAGSQSIPVLVTDLTPVEAANLLSVYDPLGDLAKADSRMLDTLYALLEQDTPDLLTKALSGESVTVPVLDEAPIPQVYVGDSTALDVVYPFDNEFGIPSLDLAMQASEVVLPFFTYNSGRLRRELGTIIFYTDDRLFESVWNNPFRVTETKAVCLVEPNFSVYSTTPLALVIWNVYRKRWLARWWQARGLRVFVDLYVNEQFQSVNLLGVPKGWSAFATRGMSDDIDSLHIQFEIACRHAGHDHPLFLVYGGSLTSQVADACKDKLWVHVPDVMRQRSM